VLFERSWAGLYQRIMTCVVHSWAAEIYTLVLSLSKGTFCSAAAWPSAAPWTTTCECPLQTQLAMLFAICYLPSAICVSSQFFGESLAVAGLLTEPPWLGQETGHSHPGLLRGYPSALCHLPSAICHQPSAISHLPSAISGMYDLQRSPLNQHLITFSFIRIPA